MKNVIQCSKCGKPTPVLYIGSTRFPPPPPVSLCCKAALTVVSSPRESS